MAIATDYQNDKFRSDVQNLLKEVNFYSGVGFILGTATEICFKVTKSKYYLNF